MKAKGKAPNAEIAPTKNSFQLSVESYQLKVENWRLETSNW